MSYHMKPVAELEKSNKLAGNEIVWVDDALDAFFLEIQGSGRVYIPETNETIRVAYANQNGRPYRSIGRYLIDKGELKPGQASAQQIKKWLKNNPRRFREVLDSNPSYVFFREEKISDPSVGPNGAQGVPLTPERSLPSIHVMSAGDTCIHRYDQTLQHDSA